MFIPLAYQIWKTLKAISNQRVSSKYRVEPETIKSNDNDIDLVQYEMYSYNLHVPI